MEFSVSLVSSSDRFTFDFFFYLQISLNDSGTTSSGVQRSCIEGDEESQQRNAL